MRVLGILASTVLIIPSLLLMTGCPPHNDSLYGVKVTGDGAGGAIALLQDNTSGDVFAQKISPGGEIMWGEKGVFLGESNSQFFNYVSLNVIGDSSGGAIVSWPETTSKQPPVTSLYHINKLDSDGRTVWQREFESVGQIISDGSGGVIFDHGPDEETLFIVKIDASGNFPWGENGVALACSPGAWQTASDGAGGAIIIWKESQYPSGVEPGKARATDNLFVERINAKGEFLWGDDRGNGMLVYEFPDEIWIDSLEATEDDTGGVIMAWYQVTEDSAAESGHQQTWDIVVQKIDAGGDVLWQPGGVPFGITKADTTALPMEPALVQDGAGSAIVIWRDTRHDAQGEASIYAQKIDEDGNLLWQAGGIKVSATSLNPYPKIVSNSPGEAVISYSFNKDWKMLYGQKIDSNGQSIWQDNGVPITENGFSGYSIASDGQGGIIAGWGVAGKASIQRVNADGKLLWGEDGIRLNP
jgi:hypothetical protein